MSGPGSFPTIWHTVLDEEPLLALADPAGHPFCIFVADLSVVS